MKKHEHVYIYQNKQQRAEILKDRKGKQYLGLGLFKCSKCGKLEWSM